MVVAAPGVSAANFGIAMLASDRPGLFVRAVICGAGSVRIVLNKPTTRATRVSWLVLG